MAGLVGRVAFVAVVARFPVDALAPKGRHGNNEQRLVPVWLYRGHLW